MWTDTSRAFDILRCLDVLSFGKEDKRRTLEMHSLTSERYSRKQKLSTAKVSISSQEFTCNPTAPQEISETTSYYIEMSKAELIVLINQFGRHLMQWEVFIRCEYDEDNFALLMS